MKKTWQIKDLIDLEHFLGLKFGNQAGENVPDGMDFDRKAYLSFPDHGDEEDEKSYRKRLIRHWLDKRRELEKHDAKSPTVLPGEAFSEAMSITKLLVGIVAFVFGAGLTWSLLTYTGREPVNVFTCLWVLVVPQVLLLLALLLSILAHKMKITRSFQILYPLFSSVIRSITLKTTRFAGKKMNAERANRIRNTYSLLGKTTTVYGSVFFWPVFVTVQLFAVIFNLGVLGALFLKVAITDLAFGWQTTLQVAPESVHRFVEIVALPWSWLVSPPTAHPTLSQIAGSQMILKDGILHLATGDLVAWWPFIFLTVLFYGLMPRLLLVIVGYFKKHRALESLDFSHGACDRLIMRMKTPAIETQKAPYQPKAPEEKARLHVETDTIEPMDGHLVTTPAIVLVPAEILHQLEHAGLEKQLNDTLGMHPVAVIPTEMDARTDTGCLKKILSENQDKGFSLRIVIVQEAWQPPIKETISWIKALRTAGGGTAGMIIALIGKPDRETVFTVPATSDQTTWEHTINSLKDPYVRIEILGGGE